MSTVQPSGSGGEEKAHIFTDDELVERIRHADIVIGVNSRSGEETIYFGLKRLEIDAKGRIVKIPVNYDTDEPDLLAAACVTAKGSCDYGKPGSSGAPRVES
jgi:hypothetical protein